MSASSRRLHDKDFDVDLDIVQQLEEKRRQLDDEIAQFRALKEREFQQFKTELRLRIKTKKESESTGADIRLDLAQYPASATASLKSDQHSHTRKTSWSHSTPSINLTGATACLKVTAPTTALDRTTIERQDTPVTHPRPITSTPALVQQISRTPSPRLGQKWPPVKKLVITSPDGNMEKQPSRDVELCNGALTSSRPALPDEHTCNTQPTSPIESRREEAVQARSSSLPLESSFSPELQVVQTKRAYTSPLAGSRRTLPSIIRNADERKRLTAKRKHVTFQLADNAIVEPSSSYEEVASPGFDSMSSDSDSVTSLSTNESQKGVTSSAAQPPRRTGRDMFGRRRPISSADEPGPGEVGMGMGDILSGEHNLVEQDGVRRSDHSREDHDMSTPQPRQVTVHDTDSDDYFSPRYSDTNTVSTDTTAPDEPESPFRGVDEDRYLRKRRQALASRHLSKSHRQQNSPDSVGKCSPLASPPYIPLPTPIVRSDNRTQQLVGSLQDRIDVNAASNIGFFELDEELASPNAVASQPFTLDDLDDGLPDSGSSRGQNMAAEKIVTGTSVPINIIRSVSGSFNGDWRQIFDN